MRALIVKPGNNCVSLGRVFFTVADKLQIEKRLAEFGIHMDMFIWE